MEFVVIDFETANESRGSACEVSAIRFQNGVATDNFTSLIYQNRFSPFNSSIHGITESLVSQSPPFDEVWPRLRDFIGTSPLVSHNAGFDISVLFHSLENCPLDAEITYFCTMVFSRKLLKTTYFGLPGVTETLGIEYPMEHRAESDALAAGKVALALLKLGKVETLQDLANNLQIKPGQLTDEGFTGSFSLSRSNSLTVKDREKILSEIGETELYEDPDFAGKKIAFTGTLMSMTRREAEIAVLRAGGLPVSSVSAKTNMLIFGYQDPRAIKGKPHSAKRLEAEKLKALGKDIEVVDEVQFIEMLADRN